jgi:D-alanyl-D-alanine dipeptidase
MYKARCTDAQARMADVGIDYLFVAPSSDMLYLVGYAGHITERLTLFVLPAEGEPVMVLPAFEARRMQTLATFFSLKTWEETDDPMPALKAVLGQRAERPIRIGYSDQGWASFLLRFQERLPKAGFVAASQVLTPMRMCKRPEEIELLRETNRANDAAFAEFITRLMTGMTERQLYNRLGELMVKHGQDSVAFANPYSGPNSSLPHHIPGDRVIQEGDVVLFDFGGRYKGYYSDTSRTVVVGQMPEEFEQVYNVVRVAQPAAIDVIQPGIPIGDVDKAARDYITEAGYGQYFTHRVGHGVGLDEHEPPYLTGDNRAPLQAGMTFSVEPGIYLPGRWGVRIEDTLLVTETGSERLSHCTREIQVVS